MPRWALGLAALGRPAYINTGSESALPADRSVEAMRDNTFAVLDAAVRSGIDWIDTARSYGLAEEFLGQWLMRRSAAEPGSALPQVSSKWGYAYVGDWQLDAAVHEEKQHSPERFRSQWALSRSTLGRSLQLYQVHSLTLDSPLFTDRALLAELAGLRDGGMRLGFSTSGPAQSQTIDAGLELKMAGDPLFTAVQSTWNLWETSAAAALNAAAARDVLVLVKEPLANGRLITQAPAAVRTLAAQFGCGPDAIALAAAAAQPWADRILLGAASVEQLRANLLADSVRLTVQDLESLVGLTQEPDRYWSDRAALPWQ